MSTDELEWQLAAFQYLLSEFGGLDQHRRSLLVNPDGDYFADSVLTGHARAEQLLDEVKSIADMAEWPTRLAPAAAARGPQHVSEELIIQSGASAIGTYQLVADGMGGSLAQIRYDESLLGDLPAFVATLAHELSHYLLSTVRHSFPGGEDMHELLTDLTATFLGFGIFLANNARSHRTYQHGLGSGWQSSHTGYLSERALITALVISERLAGRDPALAEPYLKSYLKDDLKLVTRWFARRDVDADVMAVSLTDYQVVPFDESSRDR